MWRLLIERAAKGLPIAIAGCRMSAAIARLLIGARPERRIIKLAVQLPGASHRTARFNNILLKRCQEPFLCTDSFGKFEQKNGS
jgi:hypothetical protein